MTDERQELYRKQAEAEMRLWRKQMERQRELDQLLKDLNNGFSMQDQYRPKNILDADWRTIDGVKEIEG